jgi:hypothetical protein
MPGAASLRARAGRAASSRRSPLNSWRAATRPPALIADSPARDDAVGQLHLECAQESVQVGDHDDFPRSDVCRHADPEHSSLLSDQPRTACRGTPSVRCNANRSSRKPQIASSKLRTAAEINPHPEPSIRPAADCSPARLPLNSTALQRMFLWHSRMTVLPASRSPGRPGTITATHPVAACGNWQLAHATTAGLRLVIRIPIRHLLPARTNHTNLWCSSKGS